MAVQEITPGMVKYQRRLQDYFTYKTLFNVIGWGIMLLVVVLLVIPAAFNGAWQPFSIWSTWNFLLDGLWVTLQVAFYSIILSMLFGILLALGRLAGNPIISIPSILYIEVVRALPSYLIIFYAFIGLPKIGVKLDAIWFAVIGLTIYTSAILAEIVRAGILSVEKGQLEAAYSLGLKSHQTLYLIVMPQALRRMVPSIVSQLITLTKDTSLAAIIALQELTRKGQQLYQFNGNILETMFIVGMIYFVVCYILSFISSKLEVKQLA
jgi:His/Glu/Gln/Arg/opine family amino acid ABC transporter permease subunit